MSILARIEETPWVCWSTCRIFPHNVNRQAMWLIAYLSEFSACTGNILSLDPISMSKAVPLSLKLLILILDLSWWTGLTLLRNYFCCLHSRIAWRSLASRTLSEWRINVLIRSIPSTSSFKAMKVTFLSWLKSSFPESCEAILQVPPQCAFS